MGTPCRIAPIFLSSLIVVASFVGCTLESGDEVHVERIPLLLQRYSVKPKPETLLVFPPVPLLRLPKGLDTSKHLSNPSFEYDRRYWAVSGPKTSVCGTTDLLSADGRFCLQVLISAGDEVFVSQTLRPKPRTFYSFSAIIFIPGIGEAALEVRDMAGNTLLRGDALSGPMSEWSYESLTFVTGNSTERITVGIHCSGAAETSPILIDQCAMRAFPPAENFLPSGTMETEPEEGRMPEWYVLGHGISPRSKGYQSEYALELPPIADRVSSVACLIPVRPQLDGRAVWISAMTKSVSEGDALPPEVDITLRLNDSEGALTRTQATSPATGDWVETTLMATMPNLFSGDDTLPPPFHVLFFERPAGIEGRAYIDEVVMLAIPEIRFDGGLPSAAPSR